VAACAEALDRADSGDHEAAPPRESLGGADVGLTPDDLREIAEAAARIAVHGHRYSESSQRMIDR